MAAFLYDAMTAAFSEAVESLIFLKLRSLVVDHFKAEDSEEATSCTLHWFLVS